MTPDVVRLAALAVGACALAGAAAAEQVVRRQISLGGDHGSVTVEVPSGWRFEAFPHDDPPSATVRFGPASDEFDFRLGLLWVEPSMRVPLTTLKERVRLAANDALLKSVETQAELREIRGKRTAGYCYALRDKRPGEYPYLTQGIAVTGPVTNVFTLFSRSDDPAERERALRMIASATWSDAPKTAARASPPPLPAVQDPVSLRIDEVNDTYRLTVPVSHFVLTIRKGGLKRATTPAIQSSRYFLLKDAGSGTVVSGFFDFAERFEGLEKFWAHETSSLERRSSPAPEDVQFRKVGAWDAIVYDQPVPGGSSAHVRAEWVSEGTWIDLHLSLAGKRQPAEARDSLLQLLGTFRVEDKD
ncbi:MAG TPA: hypothetical protein VFA79_17470 [Myxococcales bacterium]|nr:hypothetical protein [Myxococcales bacterium]